MKNNIKCLGLVIILAASLNSCTQESTEQQLVTATKLLQEGNNQEAIFLLKKAALADPTNSEIRFKLGRAYLNTGSPAPAEKELKLALELGYEPNITIPLIAKTLQLQFKNNELVEFVKKAKGLSLEAMTTLYTLQAQAYFALNDTDAANTSIFNANELSADSPYSKLGMAYSAFNKNELSVALNTINNLLKQDPDFAEALLLKGQLENSNGDFEAALDSFEKYHTLLPNLFQGRVYLADSYIKNNMLKKAEKHVDFLLKLNKNSPFINQLKSQIKYQQNDYESAKSFAENAINYGGANQVTNTIAAVSAYQLGLNEQAYFHLSNSIDALPKNHQLRGLYEILKLKFESKDDEEIDQEALAALSGNQQSLLIQSAYTLSKKGRLEQARNILEVIDSTKVEDPGELTRLSMVKLAVADTTAYLDLEKILKKSPEDIVALSILAKVYAAEGKIEKALKSADDIIEYHPKRVEGYNLKGLILANKGEFDEAKLQYQQAITIAPKDIEANLFFAKYALKQENEVEALRVYRRLINFEPIHLPSLVPYFALEHKVGIAEDAIKPIERAYNANPTNSKYALFYAKLLESEGRYEDALSVLKKMSISKAYAEPYWKLLVDIYLRQGKLNEIESTLLKWTANNPESGLAWRYLANLYENKGQVSKALIQVQKGLAQAKTERDNLLVLEIQQLLYLDRTMEANQALETLTQLYSADNPVVAALKGQLLMLKGDFKNALPLLIQNYHFKPSTKVLKLILNCHVRLNDRATAIEFTNAHLEKFPTDNTAKLYLAGLVINDDKPQAESIYRQVLESDSLNQIAINNLAAVLQQQGREAEAVKVAEAKLKQAPNEPYLLEIYASALLKNNQPDEAISAYSKAYKNSGKALTYAEFYVDALRKTGNELMATKISQEAGLK